MPVLKINENNIVDATPIIELFDQTKEDFEAENVLVSVTLPTVLPVRSGSFFMGHGFVQCEPEPEVLGTMVLHGHEYTFHPVEENKELLDSFLNRGFQLVAEVYTGEIGEVGGSNTVVSTVEAFYLVEERSIRLAKGCGWE